MELPDATIVAFNVANPVKANPAPVDKPMSPMLSSHSNISRSWTVADLPIMEEVVTLQHKNNSQPADKLKRSLINQGLYIVLEGPVSRPDQDQKKTRPRLVFSKDCSLGLSNFQMKDCRKTGLLCPTITPSNVAQEHVNWLKTDRDIQHFVK